MSTILSKRGYKVIKKNFSPTKLNKVKTETDFYKVCDQIKARRNGQYPPYLSREVLDIYNNKFSNELS